jgi:hypothetical protein
MNKEIKTTLPKASVEQQTVVDCINNNNNCIVDSVAGSGKTTTIFHIASSLTDLKILLLTYNAKLKLETRNKIESLQLNNLEAHNYHSFGVKYYSTKCNNDHGLINVVNDDIKSNKQYFYDLVILDESQDMTPLYYQFITKIMNDMHNTKVLICVFGDKFQSIYDFNKADNRFIIFADNLFPWLKYKWMKEKLSISFRMTIQIAEFINKCALHENRIKALKSGTRAKYIICNTFSPYALYQELEYYINMYGCEHIFVLAPSVRSDKSPIRTLANFASKKKINIYVPNNDDEKIDEDIIKNKVVFSTFHQVKGLERKVVLIFGFDNSYFVYYKKNAKTNICPNEIYVALTRPIECLVLFHHYTNDYLEFLNINEIKKTTIFIEKNHLSVKKQTGTKSNTVHINELTRYIPSIVLNKCMELLKYNIVTTKSKNYINIPVKTTQKGTFEIVSELTSVAVPAYYQYVKTNKITIFDRLIVDGTQLVLNIKTPKDILELSNKYCSKESGYTYKLNQITDYSWLSQKNLNACIVRLEKHISIEAKYEVPVLYLDEKYKKLLHGNINCSDKRINWMFKCVEKLTSEQLIQFAIYAYINELTNDNKTYKLLIAQKNKLLSQKAKHLKGNELEKLGTKLINLNDKLNRFNKKYRIMNILTHEIRELDIRLSDIKQLIILLLDAKYGNNSDNYTDEVFIKTMLEKSKYK